MKKSLPPFAEKFASYDEKTHQAVSKVAETAFLEGELDVKTKLLIAMALDAYSGSPNGVASLSKQAREAGATENEIKETIRVAYYIAGLKMLSAASAAITE